jgi:hypothetical protein
MSAEKQAQLYRQSESRSGGRKYDLVDDTLPRLGGSKQRAGQFPPYSERKGYDEPAQRLWPEIGGGVAVASTTGNEGQRRQQEEEVRRKEEDKAWREQHLLVEDPLQLPPAVVVAVAAGRPGQPGQQTPVKRTKEAERVATRAATARARQRRLRSTGKNDGCAGVSSSPIQTGPRKIKRRRGQSSARKRDAGNELFGGQKQKKVAPMEFELLRRDMHQLMHTKKHSRSEPVAMSSATMIQERAPQAHR